MRSVTLSLFGVFILLLAACGDRGVGINNNNENTGECGNGSVDGMELPRIGGHLGLLRRGQLKLQWADVVDV